jgi:hypothetical protein
VRLEPGSEVRFLRVAASEEDMMGASQDGDGGRRDDWREEPAGEQM